MKIAFVIHDYNRAGVGQMRYVHELASRFSHEHEVHVFANRFESDAGESIRFHHVPAWRANTLTTVLSFAATSTFQIRNEFDIIHSQGFCGLYGDVFTAHICNRAWDSALRKLEGGVTLRESIFNAFATTLEHFTYRRARGCEVIAVSERIARDIEQFYHCTASMHVIYHGVDLETFSPANRARLRSEVRQQLNLGDKEFAFLYVGHLRKGAKRCIQAMARIAEGRLICVSATESGPYRELVDELGLGDRVQFIGFTQQVDRFYAAADALLLPTPYDAFAMVVTEGMSCGLPVVVSREAGASELIENCTNGLVLKDLTSDAELAAWMQLLLHDRLQAENIGRAARKTVERLSWDSIASQTMRVYEQMLAKKGAFRMKIEPAANEGPVELSTPGGKTSVIRKR